MVRDQTSSFVEIVSSRPLPPVIQSLDSPPRLVIDLTNARLAPKNKELIKRVSVLQDDILTLRTEQYQQNPPVVRVVLDLLIPYDSSWEVSGDHLIVRLKPIIKPNMAHNRSQAEPAQVLAVAAAGTPAFVPVSSGIGEVVLADKRFAAGSNITAELDTAVLRLTRGGEVRVCPGTTLSVTPSRNSKDLMLGMSTGGIETHYSIGSSADTVLTPDFHILFAGPGEFDYAVSTDSHGNTCVRGLAGNASSAIVSELIGNRLYQVKPSEQVVFRLGRIDKVDNNVPPGCGCPQPAPVMRAQAAPKVVPDVNPANVVVGQTAASSPSFAAADNKTAITGATQVLSAGPETAALPPSQPSDMHVVIEAPFVFRGKPNSAGQAAVNQAPVQEAEALPVTESPARSMRLDAQVQPPAEQGEDHAPSAPRRVLGRIKGFFGSIFH